MRYRFRRKRMMGDTDDASTEARGRRRSSNDRFGDRPNQISCGSLRSRSAARGSSGSGAGCVSAWKDQPPRGERCASRLSRSVPERPGRMHLVRRRRLSGGQAILPVLSSGRCRDGQTRFVCPPLQSWTNGVVPTCAHEWPVILSVAKAFSFASFAWFQRSSPLRT
jgi:hypothetical protein